MNFKQIAFAATAAFGLLAASQASALIVVSGTVGNQLYTTSEGVILDNFDLVNPINNVLTTFTGNIVGPQVENGDGDFDVSNSAPPPYRGLNSITVCCQKDENNVNVTYEGDPTRYASVQKNNLSTYSVAPGFQLTTFNFYMGSPDSYNFVTFNFIGGSQEFEGDEIWGGNGVPGNGDRRNGFRVYYDFNGAKVTSITFESRGADAFEFDGMGGNIAAIPEPGTWALMIMGFGGAGAMLRRRRVVAA